MKCTGFEGVNNVLFAPDFSRGDHKQKYYWGHKEILIPSKFALILTLTY